MPIAARGSTRLPRAHRSGLRERRERRPRLLQLKHAYQDYLERDDPRASAYVYLHGDEDLIRRRWRSEGGTS